MLRSGKENATHRRNDGRGSRLNSAVAHRHSHCLILHALRVQAGTRAIDFANNRQQSGWNGDFSLSIAWLKERGAADDAPLRAKLLKPKWFKKGDEKTRMLKTCKDGNERLRVKTSANQSEESTNAEKMKRARLKSQRLHDENKHSL